MRNSTKFADLVAGILNEQLAATQMRLPHGNRQPAFPAAVKIAEPAIFIAISMLGGMSFHKTCSVTCLGLSSRCTADPSGSGS